MLRILTFALVAAAIGGADVHAQRAEPAPSTVQRVRGVVKAVSPESLLLTVGANEMAFAVDSTTSVTNPNKKGTFTNDLVYRGTAPRRITDYVSRGDRVTIVFHESEGALHITQIQVAKK